MVVGAHRAAVVVGALLAALAPLTGPAQAAVSQPPGLPWSFEQSGYAPRAVPVEHLPENGPTAIPLADSGVHDAAGVRMVSFGGVLYDHPWGQAAYGMQLLNAFRITGDVRYLQRARAQARRLLDTKIESRGAWFLPHKYPFERHGDANDPMPTPFYSAMAQGGVLSFFVRMFTTTGETGFRVAADKVFLSFTLVSSPTDPWVVEVDANQHLWLEEWPVNDRPDWTYNGHTFANYGLYDYARLTGDQRAVALFDGAATSTLQLAGAYRMTGWISRYCLAHVVRSARYHGVHVKQLDQLGWMTGDVRYFRWADSFFADYPTPHVQGSVQLAVGVHVGYRFSDSGAALSSRSVRLTTPQRVPVELRTRIKGRTSSWYLVTRGALAGYYVQESATAYLLGTYLPRDYSPARRVTMAAGSTVYLVKTSSGGWVVSRSSVKLAAAVVTTTSRRAVVDGRSMLLLDGSAYRGRWVSAAHVTLD